MDAKSCSIGGELVAVRQTGRMEDTMQAFAVRAACFIGEQEVPYTEEFDGQDFGATHLVAYLGAEPVGAVRIRWFQSFAMPERLAVMSRFRGHDVGGLLLERARSLAENRGCRMLYTRVQPGQAAYFEHQGWKQLEEVSDANHRATVAVVRAVDPAQSTALGIEDVLALSRQYAPSAAVAA